MIKKILITVASIIVLAFIVIYITTRPTETEDGTFIPSPLALKLATSSTTNYDNTTYENKYTGNKKVLMICTEERNMTMANGKKFSTGNHPVEMLLPILHLKNAGFDVDVVTPTGKPVKIEMWAMPEEDENVKAIYSEYKNKFENPESLNKFVNDSLSANTDYLAVLIPGGHGAMLGLPENKDLNKLIHWSYNSDMYMLAICHGPAALLAASLDGDKDSFIYNGYKIAAFPDAVDAQGPMIGYTPGNMPWIYGKKLNNLGVTIINEEADNTVFVDRKLITGASPQAANDFGKTAAQALLEEVNK
ncbi:MAG: protein deglycase HchA [Flaviramulus sp.]|nr:glyoxalase III HchA [Flaviramulus sp.]NNC51108.1 protein deglycase HchA [Flaviramulus sp.]